MWQNVDINYWAVLVSGIVCMVIGAIWYMPAVFGSMWAKEIGKSEAELRKGAGPASYVLMFIGALVMSYVLAHFVFSAGAKDAMTGAETGFWAWLGFVATANLGKKAFSGTSWTLYAIESGYYLLQLVVIGAILGMWMK